MVDAETIFYVGLGSMALMGSGLLIFSYLNDKRNPKIYLKIDEINRLSQLEQELRKEKEFLDNFGTAKATPRYAQLNDALELLIESDYRNQGWIRSIELEDIERTHQVIKLRMSDQDSER